MKSVIIGAGTYGEVYLAFLRQADVDVIGFIDDNPILQGTIIKGVPVLGTTSILSELKQKYSVEAIYCPIGDTRKRLSFLETARSMGYKTPNFIHTHALIGPEVTIADEGVYILQATQIMPYVKIDRDVMISGGSNIIHHSHIKKGVFISNGVNLGASVIVDECTFIGMGATIMTGVRRIGKDCLIGAGAVVIGDVIDRAVMAGVPAKCLKFK